MIKKIFYTCIFALIITQAPLDAMVRNLTSEQTNEQMDERLSQILTELSVSLSHSPQTIVLAFYDAMARMMRDILVGLDEDPDFNGTINSDQVRFIMRRLDERSRTLNNDYCFYKSYCLDSDTKAKLIPIYGAIVQSRGKLEKRDFSNLREFAGAYNDFQQENRTLLIKIFEHPDEMDNSRSKSKASFCWRSLK